MHIVNGKLPIFDIHTATYLELKNNLPKLTMQGTRVVFEFDGTDEVYKLLREYQENFCACAGLCECPETFKGKNVVYEG